MKLNLNLKKKFQRFCLVLICLVVLIFQSDIPNLKALTMDNYQGEMVTEELRLKVPADVKATWLNAEKEIWEPWLSSQDGWEINNIDSVLVAERPKIMPHIKLMKKNISEILNIDENLIGIKATTNEKLGPEGREEGISCHSVVLLEKK